ncbi:hypothetical protein ACFP9V_22900 [Deinococcus radiopugnans]|uniref:Opacity protein-like surface antigen n=1 Tax=Deinococcus radiopugnans ATCC 19172 TaxID=585398 RepID=A0A5C4Y6U3_9DEIO|nr:hypothetical protein [Deinococcus radiopugnans]MBB6017104.1 opacity protein-like surface antigen [Deinococcus radiopugnans ATCC 19172]TNM70666.1 hypothetical protein FHR04_12245 [Deinococcus radiopugnans ATCC 19172]
MKKLILTTLTALTLATTAFAAPVAEPVTAMGGDGIYTMLYTESAWMSLIVPMADLNYVLPSDLSLAVSGLPSGTTITLDSVTQQGDLALFHVTVSRADESVGVNDTAVIDVQSGGQTLTTVSIPVMGVAYDQ